MAKTSIEEKLQELEKQEKKAQERKNALTEKRKKLERDLKDEQTKELNFAKYIIGGYMLANEKEFIVQKLKAGAFSEKEIKAICKTMKLNSSQFI